MKYILRNKNFALFVTLAAILVQPTAVADTSGTLPELMHVPAGNYVAWRAPAQGFITYACRLSKVGESKLTWTIVGENATLGGRTDLQAVYASPPNSWRAQDGSSLTGLEVVRAHVGSARLYDQLVLANPAPEAGILSGVTYIQRIVSSGGAAPASRCDESSAGDKTVVQYHAEYVFWKPN
jgi:hypothetical protein